jgi:hypothetical protein
MKSEDFKELQEFCHRKGYQLLNESLEDNTKFFVVSKKKDEWEGVEFVECIGVMAVAVDRLKSKTVPSHLARLITSRLEQEDP